MDERAAFVREFWKDRGRRIDDPRVATHFRNDEALDYDYSLALKFCHSRASVLDLGAGTCALACLLAPHVKKIAAVDLSEELLGKRALPPNITPVVSDIRDFDSSETFDLVLIFGVLNYVFDEAELRSLIRKVARLTSPGGVCIIKHQAGVHETVLIDKYSEEIGGRYVCIYRHVEEELRLLREFFEVELVDIYPPRLNRWENTHFYAYVCRPAARVREASRAERRSTRLIGRVLQTGLRLGVPGCLGYAF